MICSNCAEKQFPVMADKSYPGPRSIPWSVAEVAYGAYRAKYGSGQSMERIAERGGFYWGELDDLHSHWRRETSAIDALRVEVARLKTELEAAQASGPLQAQIALLEKANIGLQASLNRAHSGIIAMLDGRVNWDVAELMDREIARQASIERENERSACEWIATKKAEGLEFVEAHDGGTASTVARDIEKAIKERKP